MRGCLGLIDIGRGLFNYQTSWIWSTLVTKLPDTNEILALNLVQGFGNPYLPASSKFSEDFLSLNGRHYKLDQTLLQDFTGDTTDQQHTFSTVPVQHRVYP